MPAESSSSEMAAIDQLAQPAEAEAAILEPNGDREQALRTASSPCDENTSHAPKPSPAIDQSATKSSSSSAATPPASLPPLSAADRRIWGSMATHMDMFHNHFRQAWNVLYGACERGRRPADLSLRQFVGTGLQLVQHLEMHHSIEEAHIFPVLARKMPEFRAGREAAELLLQHREIHHGMEGLEKYLTECQTGERELNLSELKAQMDTWGTVLWTHLDQEVKTLGAENMRRYWSKEEMARMPM